MVPECALFSVEELVGGAGAVVTACSITQRTKTAHIQTSRISRNIQNTWIERMLKNALLEENEEKKLARIRNSTASRVLIADNHICDLNAVFKIISGATYCVLHNVLLVKATQLSQAKA